MSQRRAHAVPTLLALCLSFGCGSSVTEATPPPLPAAPSAPPSPVVPAPAASAGTANAAPHTAGGADDAQPARAHEPEKTAGARASSGNRGLSLYELAKRGEATLPTPTKPAAVPVPAKVEPAPVVPAAVAPAPVAPAPVPAKPRGSVTVPATANVRIDVPSGLQSDLDADTRMQAWLNKVVSVIDGCFTKERQNNAALRGTIEAALTMHENERPDADLRVLPAQLSGLVACATGSLMRTKMPLFTGKDGQRYNVKLHFGE